MIKKLRRKFIAACMISLAIVLIVILGGVNLMSYQKVVSDADTVLALLASNKGTFPKTHTGQADKPVEKNNLFAPRTISPETPYESRFFSVVLDENSRVLETDTDQIAAVDGDAAAAYAQGVANSCLLYTSRCV